jgi:uncharacterized protein YrrD
MQNEAIIKKWSDLQGLAAITLDNGKKVGTIDNFYFDPETHVILAFLIKTGIFGQRVILTKDLTNVGTDALTFADENALVKESHDDALKLAPLGKDLLSYRILSEGGTVIGTIGNISLDVSIPATIRLVGYELAGGLRAHISGHYPSFAADQIIRYGKDVLVISDSLAQSLQA